MRFTVITSYDGNDYSDCISLVPGDTIADAVELNDFWVRGTNQRNGFLGIFPKSCVIPADVDDSRLTSIPMSNIESEEKEKMPSLEVFETKENVVFPKDKTDRSQSNDSVFGAYSPNIALHSCTAILFKSERGEHKRAKMFAGVAASLLMGSILLLLLVFSFNFSHSEASVAASILTLLLAISLGSSSLCRCAISLIFPNFFTDKGRAVLLSIIFGIMLTGPITNITDNAQETSKSLACLTKLAAKQTKAVQQGLAAPIEELTTYVDKQRILLEESLGPIHDISNVMDQQLKVLFNAVDDAYNAIDDIVQTCNKPIEDFVTGCKKVCQIDIIDVGCNDLCNEISSLKSGCKAIKSAIDATGVNKVIHLIKSELIKIKEYYTVDIEVTKEFSATANTSKSLNNTQKEIRDDIASKANSVKTCLHILTKFLSLSIALLFIQSFWYLRNYLSKDAYDNFYITKEFIELDKRSQTPLLPLKKKEKDMYILTSSWKLGVKELSHCKLGFIQILLHCVLCLLIVLFDWAQYYILSSVGQYGDVNISAEGKTRLNVDIKGRGPVADLYKSMLNSVNIDSNFNVSLNIKTCLPAPKTPNASTLPLFVLLYIFALVFVLLRGYGMRLRRKIAAYFYPEQERERLEYLHKKMRHKRVGVLKFLRQQIKSTHKESKVKDKLRFSTWLLINFPIFEKCINTNSKVECTSCEQQESSFNHITLTQCRGNMGGLPCDAWYCDVCSTALNNVCPICSTHRADLMD